MAASERMLGLSVPVTEVLDPKLWRERYAYGVLLGALTREWKTTSRGGDPHRELVKVVDEIPTETMRWHLRAAVSELEVKLGVPMGVAVCKAEPVDEGLVLGRDYDRVVTRRPYTWSRAETWSRIDAPSSCLSIERIRAYYYGSKVYEFSEAQGNASAIRLIWPRQGITHLLPASLASIAITADGQAGVFALIAGRQQVVPDFWAIDHTIGPTDRHTGMPGHMEAVLADWVYCAAGIKLLNLASIAVSKGITSTSVSMDGVSRSVALQASAMYGMNSCLEHVYDEAMKRIDWKSLRTYKRGLRVVSM